MITRILLIHIGSQDKTNKVKFEKKNWKIVKMQFWKFAQTLYGTHLLEWLDKMSKYELDLVSILEDTERTQFCPQTDGRAEGRIR